MDALTLDAGITRGTIPELDPLLTLKDQILNPDVAAAKTDLGVPMQDERELTRVRLSSVIVVEAGSVVQVIRLRQLRDVRMRQADVNSPGDRMPHRAGAAVDACRIVVVVVGQLRNNEFVP